MSKNKTKKPLQKKEVLENIKTVYSLVNIKTQLRQKIKRLIIKIRIKNSANQIKK
jgi:hypothetical protein